MNNISFKTNRILLLATAFLSLGTATRFCKAEGFVEPKNGENGVNRRVITPATGYTAVSGTFSEPDFFVPLPNTNADKPSFYLGGNYNQVEADAGFQFDPEPLPQYFLQPGWTVFVRQGSVYTNYSPNKADTWNKPKGSLGGNIRMTYQVNPDGTIKLTISGLTAAVGPTGFSCGIGDPPPQGGNNRFDDGSSHVVVYPPGLMPTMAVKRVVAMTQQSGATVDGSYMDFVGFSNGKLSTTQRNAAGTLTFVPVTGGWPIEAVDQGNTGYDKASWAYPASPTDPMWTSGPDTRRWIVDFDFDGMAQPLLRGPADIKYPNGEYRDTETPARYLSEKVSINLGLAPAKVDGVHLRRSSPHVF